MFVTKKTYNALKGLFHTLQQNFLAFKLETEENLETNRVYTRGYLLEKVSLYDEDIKKLEKKIQIQGVFIDDLKESNKFLKSNYEDFRRELPTLENKFNNKIESSVYDLKGSNNSLEAEVKELIKQITSLEESLADQEDVTDVHDGQINDIISDLKSDDNRFSNLFEAIQKVASDVETLFKRSISENKDNVDMKKSLNEFEKKYIPKLDKFYEYMPSLDITLQKVDVLTELMESLSSYLKGSASEKKVTKKKITKKKVSK